MSSFISVNGKDIDLVDALRCSSFEDPPSFIEGIIEREIILQIAEEMNVAVEATAIQEKFDQLRYELELESSNETKRWMAHEHLTSHSIQDSCKTLLLREMLPDAVPAEKVTAYFEENGNDFDSAELYVIVFDDMETANASVARIREEEVLFEVEALAKSIDPDTRKMAGYMGEFYRPDVLEEMKDAIFSVDPGDVIGPIVINNKPQAFLVKNIFRPTMEDVEKEIREILIEDMIEQRKLNAVVSYPIFAL